MKPSLAPAVPIAAVVALCLSGSASAATFDVNSTKDLVDADPGNGVCAAGDDTNTPEDEAGLRTLRACIMEANHLDGDDQINVPEGWYKLTLNQGGEDEEYDDLDITDVENLTTIDGTGDARFTVIDANGLDRGVEIQGEARKENNVGFGIEGLPPPTSAAISDVTVRNGYVSENDGGGIRVGEGSDLELLRSLVIHNTSADSGSGGGIAAREFSTLSLDQTTVERNASSDRGGGIHSRADSTTIENSSVSQNIADDSGGGVWLKDNDSGDEQLNPVTIRDSSIDNNRADNEGGGVYVVQRIDFEFGSESPSEAALTVERSSVSNNSADDDGGGIYNDNSFNFVQPAPKGNVEAALLGDENGAQYIRTDIVNTTLSGNIADDDVAGSGEGGAVFNQNGRVSLLNVTIADGQSNEYDTGGGIFANEAPVDFKNTILASSITAGVYDPCGGGPFTSNGNNLQTEDDEDCGFGATPDDGDQVNADPRLGGLADNGGPTRTRALLEGSEAIDAADNDACPDTDQRGEDRPPPTANAGATCDIGAYERQVAPAQPPAEQPQPQVTPQQQECIPAAPRSSISRNSLELEDNTIRLTGRAIDFLCQGQEERGGISRVRLAIALDVGSQCRFLRRSGNLGARRDCGSRRFINARLGTVRNGKVPWTFRLRGLDLPNGVYDMVALGTDRDGNNETRVRKFNHKRIRLR